MLIIFFDNKGIVHKEFVLAHQTVISHITVTFHGDCMKICEDFVPNVGDTRTGCRITTMHRLTLSFSPRTFWPKTKWMSFTTPPTFLCSSYKISNTAILTQLGWSKQNRRRPWTLTEHDFQDALKNGRSSGNGAYTRKETTSRVMVASSPKVTFWPQGRTSPVNYGWFFASRTEGVSPSILTSVL
jgi:hypothetical protein